MYYLQKVNFSTAFGDQVSFDENGDALPIYDIMNWLWLPSGRTKLQNVGEVKRSAFKGEELTINEEKIFWNSESKKVTYNFFDISWITHYSSLRWCIVADIYFSPYSHPAQCAVKAVLQVPAWPERKGNLCAVLTASLVLRERSAIRLVGALSQYFSFTL